MTTTTKARPRVALGVYLNSPAAGRAVVSAVAVLLTGALAAAVTAGIVYALAAVVVAGFLMLLAILGRDRVATLVMAAAFATAPMYKGLAPSPSSAITPTDLLFGLAAVLLFPTLIQRKLTLPPPYVVGLALIITTGMLATILSTNPLLSATQFLQWLTVLAGLVSLLALWSPGWRITDFLLWSYVAGHVLSVLYSPFDNSIGNRSIGLTHHPNAFGEAGTMAFAVCMYLWNRNDAKWYRLLVAGAAAASAVSSLTSGSRAATVVIAGLVLMIPFVERSAVKGFLLALGGALFLFCLPLLIGSAGEGSALTRLTGSGDAAYADQARLDAQDLGIRLFLDSPIIGSGFADAIFVHNILLGVLSSAGLIGMVGYLLCLFSLARPILGTHPHRRLGYVVFAFIAITPTVPGLEDRTLWVPMAPAILLAIGMAARKDEPATTPLAATEAH